jgi:aspartate/methionine/tyrosine aminotransferase
MYPVTSPLFFVNPGDEAFVPTPAHPGEDAGADIRAHARDTYDHDSAIQFYRDFEQWAMKYGPGCTWMARCSHPNRRGILSVW